MLILLFLHLVSCTIIAFLYFLLVLSSRYQTLTVSLQIHCMSSSLITCQVNSQSLSAHYDEFLQYFTQNFYHIIAISETWLKPYIPSSSVSLPNYILLRHDRVNRTGGGVAMFVHNSLKTRILDCSPSSDHPHVEYLLVEILSNISPILYAVVYRPPLVPFDPSFESTLFNFVPLYPRIIISGDLNTNFLSNSNDKSYLENLFFSLHLFIVPFSSTHHTTRSDTWLDYYIIDSAQNLLSASQLPVSFLSSHDLIQITYNIRTPPIHPRTITFRQLDTLTREKILPDLVTLDLNGIYHCSSVDTMVDILTTNLLNILNTHAPLKTSTFRHRPAPWMCQEIKDLQKRRDAARRRFRRTRLADDYQIFRVLRNTTQTRIRQAKANYFHEALSSAPDIKSKWLLLRKLSLCEPSRSPSSVFPISPDDLNSHFISVSTSSLPSHSDFSPEVPFNDNNFYFSDISPTDLITVIMKSRSNSVGPDGIPIKLIKLCLPEILPALLFIYNFSLQNSIFPTSWKKAIVLPLNKKPNPSSPEDFRPISILSNLSKPLEKLVQSQVSNYLEQSNQLDPLQSGFRPGYSTQSALIKITSDIQTAIDDKKLTILILLDFSKAFDSIIHSILFNKLKSLSFSNSSISWFQSFLSQRTQAVSIPNQPLSAYLPLSSGVAQGSSMSPLLFSSYINDLNDSIIHCSHHLYADDSQIYLSFSPAELLVAFAKIQEDLDRISAWANLNGLRLNAAKTQAILIGSKPLLRSHTNFPSLYLNNHPITFYPFVKNLGFLIDQTLSWNHHISHISRRAISTLKLFHHFRHLLPQNTRRLIVSSLIFPHFDYSCVVYDGLSVELRDRLKRLMNCFVRFVIGTPRRSRVSHHYTELGWLFPSLRRQYFLGTFLYQIITDHRPSYAYNLLQFKSSIHSLTTRSRPSDLYIPSHRSASFQNSFIARSVNFWNSLPIKIRHAPSLYTFKNLLFQFLFQKQSDTS